ncbi:hypothetical protein [Gluconobacter morbifer]|uniref:Uncharacterized protein n=1 Tax=Gluconobacter morbifer G707 TaxID=1088869 RepID=G6XMH4_9PROT|nr:hypothetical protein [Gluconobacter morbifer]EHH67072.1 hypothetical protein GMO_26920 [Gluconobacter morbifer G707]
MTADIFPDPGFEPDEAPEEVPPVRAAPGLLDRLGAYVLAQGRHLLCWLPVALGLGAVLYFALPFEPPVWSTVPLFLMGTGLILRGKKPCFPGCPE